MISLLTIILFTSMPLADVNFVGATRAKGNIAKPDCQTTCGNLTVRYPFGIGKGCSLDEPFELTCDLTRKPPRLLLGNLGIYSMADSEISIYNSVAYQCYNKSGKGVNSWIRLNEAHPFTFSPKNKFTVVGCDDFGWIKGPKGIVDYSSGCMGMCSNATHVPSNGNCSGIGCCQTSIPKGVKYFDFKMGSFNKHVDVLSFNPCGFAFLADENSFRFGGARDLSSDSNLHSNSYVPIVLDWVIGQGKRNCSQATECMGNSTCVDDIDIGGYRCTCSKGYQGNPYLDPGCEDINECRDNTTYPCYGLCINTKGSYNCTCLEGYTGNGSIPDSCRLISGDSKFPVMVFSLALVFGLLAVSLGITGIFLGIRKRKLMKVREKFFKKNGGLFLQQKLKAPDVNYAVTLFSTQQLRKATHNYSKERIIGRGGHGVVFKGILPDKRIVAIKKSILVDETQAEQFIHEVSIITQVIHRNVVKLLGLCLEEEVPLLVYEFISNNTLFYHIHHKPGGMSWLSWENRLRVAAESASALAYLHSQATMPIIHRDVKSANILLDENYTAKISDFGVSRSVPLDHDQVTTLVQGTVGYLDPEYFHTSHLTNKSDVYSFGVVLAELITGKNPFSPVRTNEEKNLANYFVMSIKDNKIFQIVDPRVLREASNEQVQAVAELVKRCLNLDGQNRPTMREVELELESLRKSNTDHHQQTPQESASLIPQVEESDLCGAPFTPYSTTDEQESSGITEMAFQQNNPR